MKELKFITETEWEKWRVNTIYTKEPETIAWIRDFEPSCVFWDIGANIGIYSIFCAAFHPSSQVYAFEPLRTNFIRLWDNIWQNNLTNIEVYYKCLGSQNQICWFDVDNVDVGSSGGIARDFTKTAVPKKQSYLIWMLTGNTLKYYYDIMPNYIKIDTDGTELDILLGMSDILSDSKLKSILVEVNQHEDEIYHALIERGFRTDEKYNKLKDRKSDKNIIFRRPK